MSKFKYFCTLLEQEEIVPDESIEYKEVDSEEESALVEPIRSRNIRYLDRAVLVKVQSFSTEEPVSFILFAWNSIDKSFIAVDTENDTVTEIDSSLYPEDFGVNVTSRESPYFEDNPPEKSSEQLSEDTVIDFEIRSEVPEDIESTVVYFSELSPEEKEKLISQPGEKVPVVGLEHLNGFFEREIPITIQLESKEYKDYNLLGKVGGCLVAYDKDDNLVLLPECLLVLVENENIILDDSILESLSYAVPYDIKDQNKHLSDPKVVVAFKSNNRVFHEGVSALLYNSNWIVLEHKKFPGTIDKNLVFERTDFPKLINLLRTKDVSNYTVYARVPLLFLHNLYRVGKISLLEDTHSWVGGPFGKVVEKIIVWLTQGSEDHQNIAEFIVRGSEEAGGIDKYLHGVFNGDPSQPPNFLAILKLSQFFDVLPMDISYEKFAAAYKEANADQKKKAFDRLKDQVKVRLKEMGVVIEQEDAESENIDVGSGTEETSNVENESLQEFLKIHNKDIVMEMTTSSNIASFETPAGVVLSKNLKSLEDSLNKGVAGKSKKTVKKATKKLRKNKK